MNQYKCESCEHHENIRDAFYNTIWCKKHDATINPSTINLVGCASHSDFQSGREKVLDELDKMIMKRTDELLKEFQALQTPKSIPVWERRLGVGEVLDMIEEIRQGDEIIENQFVVGAEVDHE
jgi:ribosome-associated translation inhibitor RaiA